ncbi:hypothetical protein AURDEDRAFT_186011 [Auricularia subglabra TFB-10046 SS5]|nr:hypothetical protein AURDEDRAFT_186011 [Auricularia subglabra TFB-10046 SS5]
MSQQLAPYPSPLGIIPSCVAQQNESLILHEKVLSLAGDSFSVTTADGRSLFEIKGKRVQVGAMRKNLTDAQGNTLFTIREHHVTFITPSYYGEDPSGNRIFDVQGKFGIGATKETCTFRSIGGQDARLVMAGEFFDRNATIKDDATGQVVATMQRGSMHARELLSNHKTYTVNVAQNVDMALIVAMCVCLDERRNEQAQSAQ